MVKPVALDPVGRDELVPGLDLAVRDGGFLNERLDSVTQPRLTPARREGEAEAAVYLAERHRKLAVAAGEQVQVVASSTAAGVDRLVVQGLAKNAGVAVASDDRNGEI